MLNDAMRVYLTRAVQSLRRAAGKSKTDAQLARMLRASFKFEADGFKKATIWRALELATGEPALHTPDSSLPGDSQSQNQAEKDE